MLDLYLDADACPVKEDAYRVAARYGMRVLVVSAVAIRVPVSPSIEPVVAGRAFDAVDDWIEAHVSADDIVVTNDLLLAARCLKKSARVVDPRGKILDDDNIGDALATRELMYELRQSGALDLGPKRMGKNHRSSFLQSLDTIVQAVRKSRGVKSRS